MRTVYFEHCVVIWVLLLLGSPELLPGSATSAQEIPHKIQDDCDFTTYPSLCVQTILGLGKSGSLQYTDMISILVNKTIQESTIANIPRSPSTVLNSQLTAEEKSQKPRSFSVTGDCETLVSMASKRLREAMKALEASAPKNKENIQTWLSAALTYQQACKDWADNGGDVSRYVSDKMGYLTELSSNALALANRIAGNRRVTTEERDFPEWVSPRDRKLLQSSSATVNADVVVAKDGSGNYRTISEAVHAASSGGGRFVIYVKSGVYKEKVRINKNGVTLIGDGKSSTVITGDDSVAGGSTMPGSATVIVSGDGFIARDIGIINTAGPQGKQALALNIASDKSALYRCSIAGYQDTLYALALRQFYRECDIYGTVDFIFGNAAAIFQNCNLILRRPRRGGSNVILANGRSDPGQNTGFSVQNCKITASSELSPVKHSVKSYLGRPWKAYSRAVVMQSNIDDVIEPRGWIEWPGYGTHVLSTLYFAEYANSGTGSGTSRRVGWPGFRVVGAGDAADFTVGSFISGNSWLPSTKVIYDSGL